MIYLIFTHFILNLTILIFYLKGKNQKKYKIWKEILLTILIGWIVVFVLEDN